MIAFRYTKTDGAEYLSHLDLLRHIDRTLRRAGIKVRMSEGFHPHPKIFMNNPLGLGVKSVAEYCAVDCELYDDFKERFNASSPRGVKCLGFKAFDENPNYAFTIDSCTYSVIGLSLDAEEFLKRERLVVTDRRGREVDIMPRIYGMKCRDGRLEFTLGCGQSSLRPDLLAEVLEGLYGGRATDIIKLASHGKFVF